jgi:hypothetical protein
MRAGDLPQVLGEDVVYILSCSDQPDLTVASDCTASPRYLAHIYRTCKIITISETSSDDLKLCFSSGLFINSGSFLPVFLPPFCHHHHFPSQTLTSINLNLSSILLHFSQNLALPKHTAVESSVPRKFDESQTRPCHASTMLLFRLNQFHNPARSAPASTLRSPCISPPILP